MNAGSAQDRLRPLLSAGALGAIVAIVVAFGLLAAVEAMQPFGSTSRLFERPELVVGALALSAALAWRLGPWVAGGGWVRALGGGLAVGSFWPGVAMFVAVVASIADAMIRGAANPLDVGSAVVWGMFALAIVWLYACVISVPTGVVWALLTRAVAHGHGGLGRRSTARLVLGLLGIGLVVGSVQAANYAPRDARCLDLPGGAPTDAAFSPAGDLLAVTMQTDPNEPGTVLLLSWPAGQVIDSWSAWTDQAVAVDPSGRVYWSAWVLGEVAIGGDDIAQGIYTAVPGSEPSWFATGGETPLNDLTWTTEALRGTTPNSHRIASIPLAGEPTMTTVPGREDVGAFWSSADGSVRVVGPGYFDPTVEIETSNGGSRSVEAGDPRSIALTSDGRTLLVASWFRGTRLIDVESGTTDLVMYGSQAFVALSRKGDVAWANEEQVGHGRLCTSTIERLRGA